MPSNQIHAVCIDSDNVKWIGTYYHGVVSFDGNNWEAYDESNSEMPDNVANTIYIGSDGTKWVGTNLGGVVSIDEDNRYKKTCL